jgi:hypothetical protein
MSWRKFLPEYDVPKTVELLVQSGVLRDKTNKQDIVPHFEARLADGSELVLWVDHPDRDLRALPDGPRYGLERYAKGRLPKTLFESNDLEEALLALRGILEERGGMRLV